MKIGYIGDLIFGDQPVKFGYGCYHKGESFFDNVKPVLSSFDYTLANFESIIRNNISNKNISNWSMCTTSSIVKQIKDAGIKGVSIANNHTMDYGVDSYNYTVECLEKEGIDVFGKKDELCKTIIINGKKVSFVCFSDLKVKADNIQYSYSPSEQQFQNIKAQLEISDIKVCYCHWGSEFIVKPTKEQINRVNQLDQLNFDVIIGHHAHVLQTPYIINNTPVFFSLGNFVSDYWQKRARKTEILIQDIKESKHTFTKIDCYINVKGAPEVKDYKEHVCILDKYKGEIATNKEINKERWLLRKEYVIEILLNFHKIKGKFHIVKWLFSRFLYIINNYNKEKKNPNIIYEKY